MTTRKPASLDGSLLARKGAAVPAVPLNSPLTEELGEPRPQATVVRFDSTAAGGAPLDATPAAAPEPASPKAGRIAVILVVAAALAALLFAMVKFLPTPDRAARDGATTPPTAAAKTAGDTAGEAADGPAQAPTAAPVAVAGVAPNPPPPAARLPAPPPLARPAVAVKAPPPIVAAKPAAPAPARKPDSAPPRPSSSPYLVQLAAVPSATAARAETARLEKRLGGVLGRNRIVTVKAAGADRRTVYRLRVGGYASLSEARGACQRIRQQKIDCLVVKR